MSISNSLVVAQLLNRVWRWAATHQAYLSSTISWSLLKLMSIELVMPFSHLILCCPLLLCLQSFSASGSFLTSQLFASGGQSIRASASASVLPINIQDWFPLGLTGLISLQSKNSQESSPTPQVQKDQFFNTQPTWNIQKESSWCLAKALKIHPLVSALSSKGVERPISFL